MTTICRHIKTNGARCGSPALSNQPYCYFHRTLAASHPRLPAPDPTPTIIHPLNPTREPHPAATQPTLHLPPLEDRQSIQLAISMTIGALARNTLDTKRAAVLLYGLQVASANARKLDNTPSRLDIVTETILAPTGDELAPDEDPAREIAYQEFLTDMEQAIENEDDDDDDEEDDEEDDEQDDDIMRANVDEPAGEITAAAAPRAPSPAQKYLASMLAAANTSARAHPDRG